MKIVWSLANREKGGYHGEFIYDMFYVSIHMAKDLGYKTELYGTSDAIEKLGKYVDKTYNIDFLEYIFFDDIKVYIWENRNDDYILMDGDMFLFTPLNLNTSKNPVLFCDTVVPPCNIDIVNKSFNFVNTLNIKSIIPEWNDNFKTGISTNFIKWGDNPNFIKKYVNYYYILKNFFIKNENYLTKFKELSFKDGLISQILCEHLLKSLIDFYYLDVKEIKFNYKNNYIHWQGEDKHYNQDKFKGITLLSNNHKKLGGDINYIYNNLLEKNLIKPILH